MLWPLCQQLSWSRLTPSFHGAQPPTLWVLWRTQLKIGCFLGLHPTEHIGRSDFPRSLNLYNLVTHMLKSLHCSYVQEKTLSEWFFTAFHGVFEACADVMGSFGAVDGSASDTLTAEGGKCCDTSYRSLSFRPFKVAPQLKQLYKCLHCYSFLSVSF